MQVPKMWSYRQVLIHDSLCRSYITCTDWIEFVIYTLLTKNGLALHYLQRVDRVVLVGRRGVWLLVYYRPGMSFVGRSSPCQSPYSPCRHGPPLTPAVTCRRHHIEIGPHCKVMECSCLEKLVVKREQKEQV